VSRDDGRSRRCGRQIPPVRTADPRPVRTGSMRVLRYGRSGDRASPTTTIAPVAGVRSSLEHLVCSSWLAIGHAHGVPTGVGYTLLLLAHVASATIGFGALCLTGFQASRARRGPEGPSAGAVRRYFRPGTNWAARTLYLVPLLGFALLAASGGAFDSSDSFVVLGLAMWLLATALAEVFVWPAERRIQRAVSGDWTLDEAFVRDCTRASSASISLALLFVVAVVVMFAKP
jgi:Predicted integral membrane protein (DUF2269)